jgi:cobalt-zinc-cadmium efflux system membrane fusion protein
MKTETAKKLVISTAILVAMGAGTFYLIHEVRANAAAAAPKASEDDAGPFKVDGDQIAVNADAIKTAAIEVVPVEVTNVPSTLTLSGRTDLDQERVTHVHAQFPGKVVAVGSPDHPLQLGDKVNGPENKGTPDTLCTIESTDLANAKAAYLQADVQLTLDNDNLERTKVLLNKQVLAEKYLQDAQAAVTKDSAILDAARQQLLIFGLTEDSIKGISKQEGKARMTYSLTSPRTGMIVEKGVVGGELADPTLNLFTVADTSTLWVWGDVYERDRPRVKEGQKMRVILTSDPEHPRECTVRWISPVIDTNTRSIKIRGDLDNTDGHLLAQMYATVVVTVNDGKNSIMVPADAVVRKGSQSYVFVVSESNGERTIYKRTRVLVEPINAGPGLEALPAVGSDKVSRAPDSTANGTQRLRVLEGLKAGDQIVRSGALGLFNQIEEQAGQSPPAADQGK